MRVAGERLNRSTFDAACSPSSSLDIDLADLTFLDPYALSSLAALLGEASAIGSPVRFVPPRNQNVANYLSRAGLGELVEVATAGRVRLPKVTAGEAPTLVPLQKLTEGQALEEAAELVFERVSEASQKRAVSELQWAILELGYNVEQHAGAAGYVTAQVWTNGPYPKVQMAIADWGPGIPETLRRSGHQRPNAETYIVEATTSRLSSKPRNGGFGLYQTLRDVRRASGTLTVRSGGALVMFGPNGTHSSATTPCQVGTLINLEMRCA